MLDCIAFAAWKLFDGLICEVSRGVSDFTSAQQLRPPAIA